MTEITIEPADGTYAVRAGGAVLGETSGALSLKEGSYDPVLYLPREDVAMAFLERSDKVTHCPHKGDATHYDIVTKSTRIANAAWSYEAPKDEVAAIAGHLAFYPGEVTVEEL